MEKVTFEKIKAVNATLKGSTLESEKNGKQYVTVNQRILGYRGLYPTGSITTKWLELNNDVAICEAIVTDEEGKTLSVAHAREVRAKDDINATSFVENCETSAVGRALGFLGIGCDASIASYEEVLNAITKQKADQKVQATTQKPVAKPAPVPVETVHAKHSEPVATAATQVVAPVEHAEPKMSLADALAHCGENTALGKLRGKPLRVFVEGSDGKGVHDMDKAKAKLSYIAQNLSGKDSLAAKTILEGLRAGTISMKPFVVEPEPVAQPEESFSIYSTTDDLPF